LLTVVGVGMGNSTPFSPPVNEARKVSDEVVSSMAIFPSVRY